MVPAINVHPSLLPENRDRTVLYRQFQQMQTDVGRLLGPSSYATPARGYVRAWVTFLGVNINGQCYYVCHIAEGFATGRAYNCGDYHAKCPCLLKGAPFHIKAEMMSAIKALFPECHAGNLPYQAALAVVPRGAIVNPDATRAGDFEVTFLEAQGTDSLSFKRNGFPLEFWTHTGRKPVIQTALQMEIAQGGNRVAIFQQACGLEDDLSEQSAMIKDLDKEIGRKEEELRKANNSLEAILTNAKIPAARKAKLEQDGNAKIYTIGGELDALRQQKAVIENERILTEAAIRDFIKEHYDQLPHSYREPTFQIAFETTVPSGQVVYKQYNGNTGEFDLCTNPNKQDLTHVRFTDGVHIPYSAIRV